ncbi:Uncharacterised protein [Nocardia brasiliensis]|nr:Uncharacterised protein [Nocardia brasiliensis]
MSSFSAPKSQKHCSTISRLGTQGARFPIVGYILGVLIWTLAWELISCF